MEDHITYKVSTVLGRTPLTDILQRESNVLKTKFLNMLEMSNTQCLKPLSGFLHSLSYDLQKFQMRRMVILDISDKLEQML